MGLKKKTNLSVVEAIMGVLAVTHLLF